MITAKFEIKDYTKKTLSEWENTKSKALEEVGTFLEGQAKLELENEPRRVSPAGRLRNSIAHRIDPDGALRIGSDVFYAIYVHEGTGIYGKNATQGGKTWWVYVKGSASSGGVAKGKRYSKYQAYQVMQYLRSKGLDAYMTQGMKPNRFLVNAVTKNKETIKAAIQDTFRGK